MGSTPTFAVRLRAGTVALTMAATAGLVVASTETAHAIASPSNFRAQHTSMQGVGLAWNSTGDDTYRVRFSTSSNMSSNADTWDVRGNYFEWTHMDANPSSTSAARLKPGATYYFQVKAISDDRDSGDRDDLSSYSKAIKVTLPKTGYNELKPMQIKATPAGADSMYVSWRAKSPGIGYVLRYTDDPKVSVLKWKSIKTTTNSGLITGLKKSTKYYFRARAIDAKGKGISKYSSTTLPSASTPASTASPRISMINYNVRKASGDPSWESRRKAVAANILSAAPDVAALQEATPLTYNGVKQYDDIVSLLGSKYSLTTRAGSSGTKLIYNTSRLTVERAGTKELTTLGDAERYASWAVFEDKISKKRFFVIDTHLEPGDQVAKYNEYRVKQAEEIVDLIDQYAGDHPVVIAGDMNSSRTATPVNGQYEVFTKAGFVDPIDNNDASWWAGRDRTAEHVAGAEYNSANQFTTTARRTSFPMGTHIDWVYTSKDVRVAQWTQVLNLDTSRKFVGTIPSDHNMFALSIHLP